MTKDWNVNRDDARDMDPDLTAQQDASPEANAASADEAGDEELEGETSTATEQLQREVEEQRDKYLRLAADFDNYRRRSRRELDEVRSRSQAELVKQMLEALDDMGRVTALDPSATEARAVIEGVEMVERKLLKALTSAGLEVINPVDEPFNPEMHEAVSTTPALSPEDDHMVAMVYQQGYMFKGQLLRPARVVVKQWNG